MNLDGARDKLEELRFFLEKLCEKPTPRIPENPNAVRYYFSAFLNAGYSVDQYVREVFGKPGPKKWEAMKEPWYKTLKSEQVELWHSLTEFGGIRGRDVHVERTPTLVKEKAVADKPFQNFSNAVSGSWAAPAYYLSILQNNPFATVDPTAAEKLGLPPGTTTWTYVREYFLNSGEADKSIKEFSQQAVDLAENFVTFFEKKTP